MVSQASQANFAIYRTVPNKLTGEITIGYNIYIYIYTLYIQPSSISPPESPFSESHEDSPGVFAVAEAAWDLE